MAQLVFIDGSSMGKVVPLRGEISIGKAQGNGLVLAEPTVLDQHAVLRPSPGGFRLDPAGPAARVAVNGKPPTGQPLHHGDILSIGDVTLLYSDEAPAAPATVPFIDATPSKILSRSGHFHDPDATVTALRAGPREQLETLYRVGQTLHGTLKLSDLVNQLLFHLATVFSPDRSFVLLSDEHGRLQVRGERVSDRSRAAGPAKATRAILDEAVAQMTAVRSEGAGEQSELCAPMVKADRILGALQVDRRRPRPPYSEDDLKLLNAIAAQAALAVDNVRSHEREQAFGRHLIRLGESARKLTASLSEEFILRETVSQACHIFECSKASVLLHDPASDTLVVAASNCIDRALWPEVRIRAGEGYAGRVFRDGKPVAVTDAPESGHEYETNSFAIAPIVSRVSELEAEPRPIGVLSVTDKPAGAPFTSRDEELLGIFASQIGIALHNARLYGAATTDPLTRIYNRLFFDVRIQEEVRTHGPAAAPLSFLMMDLDHFKDKNDVYGHPVGDRILVEAAAIVRRHVGTAGFAARYGGEEFAAILPGAPLDRAHGVAKDIRLEIEEHVFNAAEEPLHCTVSIGVAALKSGETAEAFLKRADTALYMAKRSGRNRVELAK
jgi:diguanylate cyclase (GGDEF)-like protein